MAVLVTYKYEEDSIKSEVAMDRTRSNMGFFGSHKGKSLQSEESDLAEIH